MQDEEIVQLYWDRDEEAIRATVAKYGAYCQTVAKNILEDWTDVEECVNDTWLHAWNAIPPHKPLLLSTFLAKITRNLSFDRYRLLHREKRGNGQIDLVLDELEECISGKDDPEAIMHENALSEEINHFLSSLGKKKRIMFVLRYWHAFSIAEIAERLQTSENNVSVTLNRIRKQLRVTLIERGYDV